MIRSLAKKRQPASRALIAAAMLSMAGPAAAYLTPEEQLSAYSESTLSEAEFAYAAWAAGTEGIYVPPGSLKLDIYFGNTHPLARFCSPDVCGLFTATYGNLFAYVTAVLAAQGASIAILSTTPTTHGFRRR